MMMIGAYETEYPFADILNVLGLTKLRERARIQKRRGVRSSAQLFRFMKFIAQL